MELTEDEKALLAQYQKLSESKPSLLNRLALEVIPPLVFVGVGIYSGKVIWFIALVVMMVFYNIQRVVRQHKNIVKLRAISIKTIGPINEKK